MAEDSDWFDLPSDPLITIFAALEIPDLLRCAAICSSWRRVAATMRGFRLKQTPWVMFSRLGGDAAGSDPAADGNPAADGDPATCRFYSLSEKKIYTIPLPDPPIRTRTCIGSAHGWLITADMQGSLHLLNPITRSQIALPPISTLELLKTVIGPTGGVMSYVIPYRDCPSPVISYTPQHLRSYFYEKATMSCSPLEGRDCIVMLMHEPFHRLAFLRLGDNQWNSLSNPRYDYHDFIYYGGGLFHAITLAGNIEVWDLSGPSPVSEFMPLGTEANMMDRKYLVPTSPSDGCLLQVWTEMVARDGALVVFTVHKWVSGKPSSKLVKMTSIGDHALFLSYNHSSCLPTKDFPGLRPNSIYIIDDRRGLAGLYGNYIERGVAIYHLEDESFNGVLPPDPSLDRSIAIWITPSLT